MPKRMALQLALAANKLRPSQARRVTFKTTPSRSGPEGFDTTVMRGPQDDKPEISFGIRRAVPLCPAQNQLRRVKRLARSPTCAAQLCREWGVSIRRACRALEFDTSTYHYKARRRDQAGIEARIKDICQTRVRYGYRRVHVLLRREGLEINV